MSSGVPQLAQCGWGTQVFVIEKEHENTLMKLGFFAVEEAAVTEEAVNAVSGLEVPETPLAAGDHSVLDLIWGSGAVVQGVLLVLVIMSVVTWGIVVIKWAQFISARRQNKKFSQVFWGRNSLEQIYQASQRLANCPSAAVFESGYDQYLASAESHDLESVSRALRRAKAEELTRLEQGTTFLATTASAAPFIGLFGTVWGIMNAFIGLSRVKTSSIQAVAPGISEALIATAIGLAAAIPAAIAYNYFARQVKLMARSMDTFSAEFLNIAKRVPAERAVGE